MKVNVIECQLPNHLWCFAQTFYNSKKNLIDCQPLTLKWQQCLWGTANEKDSQVIKNYVLQGLQRRADAT